MTQEGHIPRGRRGHRGEGSKPLKPLLLSGRLHDLALPSAPPRLGERLEFRHRASPPIGGAKPPGGYPAPAGFLAPTPREVPQYL